ncbi:hypothetical protein [cf. Phormidesmis sp. LEGE 11477]|uniref:hypothetical protein n=1 Tax=cf. Phormidesmis sp. LEGE 11477 TaxID=1828680 RepID=UPI001881E034|nr:hypothetical protein [cf. Phormidesmis sp. LEGE 11477]MBE9063305.1 hypothetical protein [cf. Phormidesmis sp. LEGE 11477]
MRPVSVEYVGGSGVGDDVGSDADVSTGTAFALKLALANSCTSDGLSVTLAFVRQKGLYPPVEAVPPKPFSLVH